jgi:pimeloyl-ACP methyl ester carboxylesterase
MSSFPDALWLNVSPALQGFDRPLLKYLSHQVLIGQWEYSQSLDEAMSLEGALVLLHDYLKHHDRPIHLLGHGTSGLLALLYARRHPTRVKTLTLLSVGVFPAVDWQAHYYAQLNLLPCSREMLLTQTVYQLFGYRSPPVTRELAKVLDQDLQSSLSPHTLYQRVSYEAGGILAPLLVCGGQDDSVIDPHLLQGWLPWFKRASNLKEIGHDLLWQCPNERYFFHYFQPQRVGEQIIGFWASQKRSQSLQRFSFA